MSEQVLYRGWNAKLKRMMYMGDDVSLMLNPNGQHTFALWCSDGIFDEIPVDKLMHCTGLKDKNGVKAYEQDMAKAKLTSTEGKYLGEFIGTIEFDEYEWVLTMNSDDFPTASWSLVDSFQVIGNPYENPELETIGEK